MSQSVHQIFIQALFFTLSLASLAYCYTSVSPTINNQLIQFQNAAEYAVKEINKNVGKDGFKLNSVEWQEAKVGSGIKYSLAVEAEEVPGVINFDIPDNVKWTDAFLTSTVVSEDHPTVEGVMRIPEFTLRGPMEIFIYNTTDVGIQVSGRQVETGYVKKIVLRDEKVKVVAKGAQKISLRESVRFPNGFKFAAGSLRLEELNEVLNLHFKNPIKVSLFGPLSIATEKQIKVSKTRQHELEFKERISPEKALDWKKTGVTMNVTKDDTLVQSAQKALLQLNQPTINVKRVVEGQVEPFRMYSFPISVSSPQEQEGEMNLDVLVYELGSGFQKVVYGKQAKKPTFPSNTSPTSDKQHIGSTTTDISDVIEGVFGNNTEWSVANERILMRSPPRINGLTIKP